MERLLKTDYLFDFTEHSLDLRDSWNRATHCWGAIGFVKGSHFWLPLKKRLLDWCFISFTKLARFNAIGRRVLPGVLILLVVVVVVVAAPALRSRLLVVRVCVAEHHLGRCFQPASVAGLHLWLFGLFDRCLGSRDAFTHGSSCIALFGHGLISSVVSP